MRLFLAIEVPPDVKQSIYDQLEPIRREYRQFNWVPPENFHITLHFFGEIEDQDALIDDIEKVIFDVESFHVYSRVSDLFIHKKIILYIEVYKEKKMQFLVDSIKTHFSDTQNKKYLPHLTIGRYKIPSKQQYLLLKKKLANLPVEFNFPVNTVTLFETVVDSKNPVYKKIKDFALLHK